MLWIVAEPPSPHTLLTSEETSDQTYYPEEELMDGEETEIPSGTCSEGSNSLQPVEGPKTVQGLAAVPLDALFSSILVPMQQHSVLPSPHPKVTLPTP
ncbi:unnamed protein product [Caretta caretta]